MKGAPQAIGKIDTGIPGFDHLASGGLPAGRTTLVCGTSGSAKTVFAAQFLVEGIRKGDPGVFVTFEEMPDDIRKNLLSFGWDIAQWEREGKWAFVDVSPRAGETFVETGNYDLSALMVRIKAAVERVGAARLCLDSIASIFSGFSDQMLVRREIFNIIAATKEMGLTSIMTAERLEEYGPIARLGIEEFVNDNVIILRNVLEGERRRRTIEILKFRGTDHHKGEYPFSIRPGEGLIVIPLSDIELEQGSSPSRVTFGNEVLDEMCQGGIFRDSVVLVAGPTGCGKTVMSMEFLTGMKNDEERSLFFAFEESRDQVFRNAAGFGHDFRTMEEQGRLKVMASYPETVGIEDHLILIKKEIEAFVPTRIVIDSLSALERITNPKGYREFVIGITSFLKKNQTAGQFTYSTPSVGGTESMTDQHMSTLADSVILLRYVEMFGLVRRGLCLLKMRGALHDKEIREFSIDGEGVHIGPAFQNVTGILSGKIKHAGSYGGEQPFGKGVAAE